MKTSSISFGLLIVFLAILLLHWMRKVKPQIAGYGTQRMCPSLRIDHISTKSSLFGVWRGQRLKPVSMTVEK